MMSKTNTKFSKQKKTRGESKSNDQHVKPGSFLHREIVSVVKGYGKSLTKMKQAVLVGEDDVKGDPISDLRLSTTKMVRGMLKNQNALFHVRLPHVMSAPTNLATSASTTLATYFNVDPSANGFNWSSWAALFDEYKLTTCEVHYAFATPIPSGVVSTELQPLQMAVAYDPDSSAVTPASYRSVLEHVNSWVVPCSDAVPKTIRIPIPPAPAPTGAGSVIWASVTDPWPGCVQMYAVSPTSGSTFFGTLTILFEVVFRFRA